MEKEFLKEICSLKKVKEKWELYDCNGDYCKYEYRKQQYPRTIKMRYLKKREKWQKNQDTETVWVLVGKGDDEKEVYEQVARTKHIINSLDEIRDDIKEFYKDDTKYGKLKNKDYNSLIFYEVDIKSYLKDEEIKADKENIAFKNSFILSSENSENEVDYFKLGYKHLAAAYVEGKLGYVLGAYKNMYHTSTLDGYFFEFFKHQNKK